MRPRTPIYLGFATAVCIYAALANLNGWRLLTTLSSTPHGPTSTVRHK